MGSVANAAALPTTNRIVGDGWIAQDTGNLHVWDGAAWDDVGVIKGPKGDTGAQGPIGLTGSTGAAGATGAQGIAGPQGVKGDTGLQGPQGLQGVKGDTGAQGAQGIQGNTGSTGARGSNWYTGAGAPGTIAGSVAGDKYLNTTNGDVYTLS